MKGIQQPYLSIPKIFEKPLCEKILAGPLNRLPRIQPFDSKRRVDF